MRNITKLLIGVVVVLMMMGLAGCGQSQNAGQGQQGQTSNSGSAQNLVVKSASYYVDEYGAVNYAVIVENPNVEWAAEDIQVSIAARGADGNVLESTTDYITLLYANGETATCGTLAPNGDIATLEATVSVRSGNWTKESMTESQFNEALYVTGLNETKGGYGGTTIAGEVVNNLDLDFTLTRINIVFLDGAGNPVGGSFTYTDGDLNAGSKLPFSDSVYGAPAHDQVIAYVDCGYPNS